MRLLELINNYMPYIIIGFTFLLVILFILCFVSLFKLKKLRKRYDHFMGIDDKLELSFEEKLNKYIESVNSLEHQYTSLLDTINSIDKNLVKCSQKVGVIRFNPFDEMGGKLSFAVAILDGNDDGVVFNGLHSRSGSFTYAKPIEKGVSEYVLSNEEIQAIEKAKECTFDKKTDLNPIERKIKIYKVKVPKTKPVNLNKNIVEKNINEEAETGHLEIKNQVLDQLQEKEAEIDEKMETIDSQSKEIDLEDLETTHNEEINKNKEINETNTQMIEEEIQNSDAMQDVDLDIKSIIKNSLLK